jgi:hypothetical protein
MKVTGDGFPNERTQGLFVHGIQPLLQHSAVSTQNYTDTIHNPNDGGVHRRGLLS